MAHRWTSEAWQLWMLNNRQLIQRGFVLETNYLTDGTIEHWAVRGAQRIRNDPCRPLIEPESLSPPQQEAAL